MKSLFIFIVLVLVSFSGMSQSKNTTNSKNLTKEEITLSKGNYSILISYEFRPISKRTYFLENKETFKSYSAFLKLATYPELKGYKIIKGKFYKSFIIVK